MKDKDGKIYKTVTIGNQIWMAENLNYTTANGSWDYDNKPENNERYGKLYTWDKACEVCPNGWHLPSDNEWDQLINFISNNSRKENKLDSIQKDVFKPLTGGYRFYDGHFRNKGNVGIWWSSSKLAISEDVYRRVYIYSNSGWQQDFVSSWFGASVRCIKDSE